MGLGQNETTRGLLVVVFVSVYQGSILGTYFRPTSIYSPGVFGCSQHWGPVLRGCPLPFAPGMLVPGAPQVGQVARSELGAGRLCPGVRGARCRGEAPGTGVVFGGLRRK